MKKFMLGVLVSIVFTMAFGLLSAGPAFAANYAPRTFAIVPSTGSAPCNQAVYFTSTYSDGNGCADLRTVYLLVNTSITYPRSLYAYYDRLRNLLYIMNDSGTAWTGGYAPGYARVIENSYAKIDCSKTSISGSGTNLSVKWAVTFKSTFTGTKNTYLYAKDNAGAVSGWTQNGKWTITGPDITAPTGTILINNGSAYVKTTAVTLNLSAQDNSGGSGVYQMKFSANNLTWSAPVNYAKQKAWTLSSGDGKKSVYVKYSDNAGNWSSAYSASVTLDTTPPAIVIANPKSGALVAAPALTVNYTSDGAPKTASTTLQEGANVVKVSDTDTAGNTGSASVIVTLGSPAPVADFMATPTIGTMQFNSQFTDASSGTITSWLWDFGDGTTSTEKNPLHAYKNKYQWEVDYAGEDRPEAATQAWVRNVSAVPLEIEAVESGTLHIMTNFAAGEYVWYSRPAGLKASMEYAVEARVKMGRDDISTHGTMCLGVTDDTYSFRLDFTANGINLEYCTDRKGTYEMDTVSDYHTYRARVVDGIVEIFVDGVKRIKADMRYTSQYGPYTSSVGFGQAVRQSYGIVEAWWDYIRCHSMPTAMGYEDYYNVSLKVTGPGGSSTKTRSNYIDVLPPPPEIFTKGLPDAVTGDSYSEQFYVDYAIQPFTWSVISGSIPPGLSIVSTWPVTISGNPTQAGHYDFTLNVTDYKGRSDTQHIAMDVRPYPERTDIQLLYETQARAASYFYYEALSNGFVRDVASGSASSMAATGFGLAAMCILDQYSMCPDNPYVNISQAAVRARVNQILDNCIAYQGLQSQYGNNYGLGGFLYHQTNANGTRYGSSEVSTIDMAIFMAGAVTAGEYFGGEVKAKVETIYSNMNWRTFLDTGVQMFSHGWSPEKGYLRYFWDRPGDETLLVCIMALGREPDAQDFLETMYSWPRAQRTYGEYTLYNSYFGSIFTYYFAHCFIDFQKLGADNPSATVFKSKPSIDWWQNSVKAAHADRQFCIDQSATFSQSYGPDSWGLTPCYNPVNWLDYFGTLGAPPCEASGGIPDSRGVVAPSGAISCMPFMRTSVLEAPGDNLSFRALKHYYTTYYGKGLWGKYGPTDSFDNAGNLCRRYVGINVGSEALMIANYNSGFIWDSFMNNTRIRAALNKIFNGVLK